MKKAIFVLGLIGGILGIISCIFLLFIGLNMKVTNSHATTTLVFGTLGLLASIAGLVGACISQSKSKLAGILMIIATFLNIVVAFTSINANSPITFLTGLVVFILFLIASIFAFKIKTIT